ncbi:MAG: hypothetical protein UY21_C0002G0027 [Microgenomates group bacterium GW2011_GWA1_48_10]|uniref:Membrane protein 6-pyruvoyl-tetrahydropterin synthase-related domain-containing protein n=1 Tax=Candidatus Gottesmanbacteria bacterium RIFCSPHIGHO2_01_FULL_47_48 TaxID=1798381 RepID=A0A1F5ZZK7_9BACT|nr:MAG: hypothetical protein UY21_C0002G0027 [Microgenomates group bacterium GW2011_GWA1_48_10]OGG17803.1 MAG: hypothetical protein A2721_02160 [Candidatus Gottesmanbacteria bacterium RIFCSPHIGHO2_01_FULL_47_48]
MGKIFVTLGFLLVLTALSLPALSDLLKPGYFSSHDGIGHIIRLSEFDIALHDGNFPPRISKNLMWGYGYYFFNFNYPLVYYLGEGAYALGLGLVDAIKSVMIMGLIFSGWAMFLWQKDHLGNWGGLLAGFLYMYAPYRLLNIYVRGSIAEHLAFIMLPLLFMFTEKIAEGDRQRQVMYIIAGGFSYGLLMLSHNITAFIFTIVLGLFMVFHLIVYRRPKMIFGFIAIGVLGLMLSAFFWVPSLAEKKYVRLDQTIAKDYPDHFVYPEQLVIPSWGYGGSTAGRGDGLSFQIGLVQWGMVILAIIAGVQLWRKRHQKSLHIGFYFGVLGLAIFFMLPVSKIFWDKLPLLSFTQFPWRFLSWTVFSIAVLAGAVIMTVQNALGQKRLLAPALASVVILVTFFAYRDYWKANKIITVKLPTDRPIAGSTTWADEQFPIWFDPKPNTFPGSRVEIASGKAIVGLVDWKTNEHTYIVDALTDSKVVENTAYYPGWTTRSKTQASGGETPINVSYQDKGFPGRIVYELTAGKYYVTSRFGETPMRMTMNTLSAVTFFLVTGTLIILLKR